MDGIYEKVMKGAKKVNKWGLTEVSCAVKNGGLVVQDFVRCVLLVNTEVNFDFCRKLLLNYTSCLILV